MGFLSSDPKIYSNLKYHGFASKIMQEDYYTIFAPLLQMGWRWDAERKVIRQMGEQFLAAETPWCHAKGTPLKHCALDHNVLFPCFNIIHPRCLQCWKVVVTPHNLIQLFELEQIQLEMNVPCKCGIELRDYTPKFYGGYFYNHSLDEGRERYEQVRKAVDTQMTDGKNVDVILKRGCTEYEMIKGPSHLWHTTAEEEAMIELCDAFIESPRSNGDQSRMVKNHVKLRWFLWAHMNGDMTYKELNDGKSIFPDYVKYHDKPIDDIKHDLALASANMKAGIKIEDSADFLKLAQEFADDRGLSEVGILAHSLGSEYRSKFNIKNINIQEVPDEAKGDHDELT